MLTMYDSWLRCHIPTHVEGRGLNPSIGHIIQ